MSKKHHHSRGMMVNLNELMEALRRNVFVQNSGTAMPVQPPMPNGGNGMSGASGGPSGLGPLGGLLGGCAPPMPLANGIAPQMNITPPPMPMAQRPSPDPTAPKDPEQRQR